MRLRKISGKLFYDNSFRMYGKDESYYNKELMYKGYRNGIFNNRKWFYHPNEYKYYL